MRVDGQLIEFRTQMRLRGTYGWWARFSEKDTSPLLGRP